ncbi:MAG: O-antigen ligase family protein [Aggregatilineales bacterium]
MSLRTPSRSSRQSRVPFPARMIVIFLFLYFAVIGATFNGVMITLGLQRVTLTMLLIITGVWFVIRQRRSWQWTRLPVDPVLILWVIAFVVSMLANPDTWRRSAEGLWYMGVYIGILYLLLDTIGHGLKRALFSEAILMVGFCTVIFGYLQLYNLIQDIGFAAYIDGLSNMSRPSSYIGNANALGVFLVMIIPLIMTQIVYTRIRFVRIVMSIFVLMTVFLLLLTFSRGAWVGMGAGFVTFVLLWLAEYQLLSVSALRQWWQGQSARIRLIAGGMSIATLIGALLVGIILIRSFSQGGRGADLRTRIWEAAWTLFTEDPITGKGLFTFGHRLGTFWSIPPQQPHSHAHSLPLNVLAEMGVIGGIALTATLLAIFIMWRRNWRTLQTDRHLFIGVTAAAVAFGVHHLFDLPAMMPLIALMGITILSMMIAQPDAPPMKSRYMQRGHMTGLALLWLILLAAGFWQNSVHSQYRMILESTIESENYVQGARDMQQVVDADPSQPAYVMQLAYMHGHAALETDNPQPGIDAYLRYLELEPYHASAWSNLAGLYWQAGDADAALNAISEAITLSPDWEHYQYQRDIYNGTITNIDDIETPESVRMWGINWARFQYLRDIIIPEYLPQTGWGTER